LDGVDAAAIRPYCLADLGRWTRAGFTMSSHLSGFYAGAVAAALLLGGSAAHAFTIENGSGGTGGGNAMAPSPFYDSTKKYDDKNDGTSKTQFGNTTIYFGQGNSQYMRDQDFRNGMNRMFSPLGRPPD
jgi:hypothetical protein